MSFTVIVPIQKKLPGYHEHFGCFSANSLNRGFRYNEPLPTFYRCFAEDAEKLTKIYNARAQPLFCSLNLSFSDVPVPVVVFLNPPNVCQRGHGTVSLPSVQAQPIMWSSQSLKGTLPVRLLPLLKGEVTTQQSSV